MSDDTPIQHDSEQVSESHVVYRASVRLSVSTVAPVEADGDDVRGALERELERLARHPRRWRK